MKSSNKGKDFCVFALPGLFCFLAVVMVPWEVNVKPKTSTLVSQRTSQKPKGTRLWQSLRRLWNLIRAIAEIQNQTTRYLRALCRK